MDQVSQKPLKVLCDLHHRDLFYSLRLLFEKRLGFEVNRPIGLEWYHEGFWKVYDHPATAKQFLALNQAVDHSSDGLLKLFKQHDLQNFEYIVEDGIYHVNDPTHKDVDRAITLQTFKDMEFDIVIASIPSHIAPFRKLINQFQPNAKLIFQLGNPLNLPGWENCIGGVNNILASTLPFSAPGKNIVFYNQEFDLDLYRYEPPTNHNLIHSYVHNMYKREILAKYERHLQEWNVQCYGAGMGQSLVGAHKVADAMIRSGWTWHYKPRGDGYGHVVHSSYACGRPMIVDARPYRGQAGGRFMNDLVTCIDFSRRNLLDNVKIIKRLSQPEEHNKMCQRAARAFRTMVNFDEDEARIRKFMERL